MEGDGCEDGGGEEFGSVVDGANEVGEGDGDE